MTLDDALGLVQFGLMAIGVLVVVLVVYWARQEGRRNTERVNEIALVLTRQHDWACLTGPWPHDGYCEPRPGEHESARVASLAQCASFDLARVHGIYVDRPGREDESCCGE